MRNLLFLLLLTGIGASAQTTIGVYSGMVNYQGDLQPHSFTLRQASSYHSLFVRIPVYGRLAVQLGAGAGRIQAADSMNRDYLRARNLSFVSGLREAYAMITLSLLNPERSRFTPYLGLGMALFHFNPWTRNRGGERIYLQPLGTEGQGMPEYPFRKPYRLTQWALTGSLGLRYLLADDLALGLEFRQRKTFTDYLDDVSGVYADGDLLLQRRGRTVVDLAYRGWERPGGSPYPHAGEQRGTPTEKDWYYQLGLSVEVGLGRLRNGWNRVRFGSPDTYYRRCPTVF